MILRIAFRQVSRALLFTASWLTLSPCVNAQVSSADVVVVTGRKIPEATDAMPVSASTFSAKWLGDLDIRSFSDFALLVPNLSYAYGNGESSSNLGSAISNARTVAIRGISGANTTGFYYDDIPLPVSIDPRILDVHDIKVLRGPQGTLYGESSLGGNIQWVSNAPDLAHNALQYSVAGGATEHGGTPDAQASTVINAVLVPQQLALRVAAYVEHEAGFLTRTYPVDATNPASPHDSANNQGAQSNDGISATLRLRVDARFDLAMSLLAQHEYDNGFLAAYAPLPAFTPVPALGRATNIQPFMSDTWTLPALALAYQGDGWNLHSSLSYFDRHSHDYEDSTEGTAQAITAATGVTLAAQPFAWSAFHDSRQFTEETRWTLEATHGFDAAAGLYYASSHSHWNIPAVNGQGVAAAGLWPDNTLWVQDDAGTQRDISLFGELNYDFLQKFRVTVGLRHYWLAQRDQMHYDGLLGGGAYDSDSATHEQGTSPKLALSYKVNEQLMTYASASQGFRAGGAQGPVTYPGCGPDLAAIGQTSQSIAHIAPDWVWSYEAGAKFAPAKDWRVEVAAFHIDWQHIQQSIFLPHCAFYVIGNAGAARVNGSELAITGEPARNLALRAGLGYEDGRITATGGSGQAPGSRIYQQPRVTASVGAVYNAPIGLGITGFMAGDYGYTGNSISANGGAGSNLLRPGYGMANLRGGVRWQASELSLKITNLNNAKPNLGDLSYIGYQRYVTGTMTPLPQVATLPPRTVMLELEQKF